MLLSTPLSTLLCIAALWQMEDEWVFLGLTLARSSLSRCALSLSFSLIFSGVSLFLLPLSSCLLSCADTFSAICLTLYHCEAIIARQYVGDSVFAPFLPQKKSLSHNARVLMSLSLPVFSFLFLSGGLVLCRSHSLCVSPLSPRLELFSLSPILCRCVITSEGDSVAVREEAGSRRLHPRRVPLYRFIAARASFSALCSSPSGYRLCVLIQRFSAMQICLLPLSPFRLHRSPLRVAQKVQWVSVTLLSLLEQHTLSSLFSFVFCLA